MLLHAVYYVIYVYVCGYDYVQKVETLIQPQNVYAYSQHCATF